MSSLYSFFRPVLAADLAWCAIDWQRGKPFGIESSELARCFAEAGAAQLASQLPLIAPIKVESLHQSAVVEGFDASQMVFVLPTESLENPQVLARCKELRALGNRLGLQIEKPELLRQVPLAGFDYLWLDAAFARQELSAIDLMYASDAGFRIIARHVNSHEMFRWLAEKGFDWFDSRFLVTRDPQRGKEPDLTRLKLLKLLNLVKNDGDTREIESIFREEPKLSYNLLRLVNSVAVGARTKISNFSQAIAILGRRQLQRWLQLLIYANNLADGNAPNPLMQLAAARGRQLELLCGLVTTDSDSSEFCDNAFMTGLFSLLDILINLPMADILKELPLHEEVVEALLTTGQGGPISQLLAAIVAGESGDHEEAERILSTLGIDPATHAKAQISALYWATRINIENHD